MTVTLTLPPDVEDAIQAAARQQGQTTEETITDALQRLFVPEAATQPGEDTLGAEAQERQRIQTVFAELRAEAKALIVDRDASRTAAQGDAFGEAVADKFRQQGFNV